MLGATASAVVFMRATPSAVDALRATALAAVALGATAAAVAVMSSVSGTRWVPPLLDHAALWAAAQDLGF